MPAAAATTQDYFPTHPTASAALAHLSLVLFPSTYSEPFLASCIQHWLAQPAPAAGRWTTELLVEAVAGKLLEDEQEGGETGEAGRVIAWVERDEGRAGGEKGEIARSEEVRKRWARAGGGGKGKERALSPSLSAGEGGGGGKVEDVTLARNLALIRLHALFPLVPIVEIRVLLLSLEHTFLHQAIEELLLRTQSSSASRRKEGGGTGQVEVVDLAEVGRSVLAGLRSFFKPPPLDKGKTKTLSNAEEGSTAPDPVLTPHDLFRPPSHTRALLAHFTTLFPSLPSAFVRRAVEEEGGSYAAVRAKLEVEAAERAARSAGGGGGRGKWWTGFGLFAPSSAGEGGAGAGGDVQREKDARRLVRESGNKAAQREVEAYYTSIERRPRVRRVEGSERRLEGWISDVPPPPSPPSPPAPEADEDDPFLPPSLTFECQCCFADVPLPSSSSSSSTAVATNISCDSPSSSHHPHTFCPACLLSYTQTFLTGGTPLPSLSLSTLALPCFAASSPPCTGVLRSSTLRAGLDRRTLRRLEERMAAANLELLVAASATPDGGPSPRVHRCPFCPYAEIAPPASSSSGPLSRVFFPAWGAECPPSVASLCASVVGLLALVAFAVILSLFALLCPTPLPRLEKTYADLHPPPTASTTASPTADNDPTPPPSPPLLPLPLSTTLLLSPHHLLPLSLAYIRSITERVVRRREGRRTVFRCRNSGGGGRGRGGKKGGWWNGEGEGEEWLKRLEELGGKMREYLSEEKAEGGGEGREDVEERRRRKLVELVWGLEGLDALDGATAEKEEEDEGRETCGRLSCLLCSSPVNPSAPSLHRCSTISSPSSSSTTSSDKEQAEESLRLAVEGAMSDATARRCERCGAGVVKEGGCNKVTCRCGAAYCWACRAPIPPSVGYRHFCQHFLPDPNQACKECSRCSLWKEGDEKERVREAAAAARRKWALDNPEWAKKVDLQGVVVGPPAGLSEGHPLSEEILNSFERAIERVVSLLLAVVTLETT